MTYQALIWMIVVQAFVTLVTGYLFYKVLRKDGTKTDGKKNTDKST